MGQAIRISNFDHTAEGLRHLAAKARDGRVVRRLLAMGLLLEGKSRTQAARQSGMDRQTLCDWVHRYNAEGVAGLASRISPGPVPSLNDQQMAALKALVIAGPDPEKDGVVRWRCVDLREQIIRRFSVTLHERSVGKLLRKLRLTQLQPRPCHPKQDAAAQETFKKTSPSR
jgi:transposase